MDWCVISKWVQITNTTTATPATEIVSQLHQVQQLALKRGIYLQGLSHNLVLSLSVFLSYGHNAHLYGEMRTSAGQGAFNYATIDAGLDARRGGGFFEVSYAASPKLAITLGSGFQLTYDGNGSVVGTNSVTQYTVSGAGEHILSYKVSLQTPYKVSKNFSIVPQIGYYNAYLRNADEHRGSAIGIVRFRFDI